MLTSILGTLVSLIAILCGGFYWLGRKFAKIDIKFSEIDRRFNEIDKRFEVLESKSASLENKITSLENRINSLEKRIDSLEDRISSLDRKFTEAIDALKNAILAINSLNLDFLSIKGVIEDREARFLIKEATKYLSLIKTNPLTEEEIEFLRKVLVEKGLKDVNLITLEEAERIIEIGKRWWKEEGKEEAYKLFLTGLVIRGYIISKKVKAGEEI